VQGSGPRTVASVVNEVLPSCTNAMEEIV